MQSCMMVFSKQGFAYGSYDMAAFFVLHVSALMDGLHA